MENRVREVRHNKGITQKELATYAKTTERNVRRIEMGQKPAAQTAVLMADALGADVKYLFPETA